MPSDMDAPQGDELEDQPHSHSSASVGGDVTRLLSAIGAGNSHASEELLPLVYEELRKLAARRIEREHPGQTLQATALVHEAYLRLVGSGDATWENKAHFFGAAALAMRRILVERARRLGRDRHGGGRRPLSLADIDVAAVGDEEHESVDFVALDEALRRMEGEDERMARVVMLRYFAGFSIEETAEALGMSPTSVKREWTCARAWLYDELRDDRKR
jgi:RNA polymerase sigma factor (TIGR02999 family)